MSDQPGFDELIVDVACLRFPIRLRNVRRWRRGAEREVHTLKRWIERWHRRSLHTLTREPRIYWSDNDPSDFIADRSRYVIEVFCLPFGQTHGLAPTMWTKAQRIYIPVKRPVSIVDYRTRF